MNLDKRNLRKFDIKSLQICPPHLSAVTTLTCEIQKKIIFNNTTNTHFWLIALSDNETNCNRDRELAHRIWTMSPHYHVKCRTCSCEW